jgi:NTE family protein
VKKLGLVLGGGGARCFAHIGIVKELRNHNIPINQLTCTSSGALVGALLANNVPASNIKKEFYKLSTRLNWFFPIVSVKALASFRNVRTILKNLLPQNRIENCAIPIVLVAANLSTGEDYVFDKGNLTEAVCAAMSYPGIYKPYKLGTHYLADGGITNCIPADICREKMGKKNVVISVKLESPFQRPWKPTHYLKILSRAVTLSFGRQRAHIIKEYSDLVLEPFRHVGYRYTNLNFSNKKALERYYWLGREEAKANIGRIKRLIK